MKEKGKIRNNQLVIRVTGQKYRVYHGCRFLQPLTKILPEQMRFCAVQQKGQDDDDRKRIERCITFELSVDYDFLLTCNPLIGVQVGGFYYRLQPMVEFPPCYTEEPHKLSLRHSDFAIPLANDLYFISPIEITTLIVYAYFSFGIIDSLHKVH